MTDLRYYLGVTGGPAALFESDEATRFKLDNYDLLKGYFGVEFPILKTNLLTLSPVVDLGYEYMGGSPGNFGSHKYQLDLLGGARLTVTPYFFAEAKFGITGGSNVFNYGKGTKPTPEGVFGWKGVLQGGPQYCADNGNCLAILAGFQFGQSLAGSTDDYDTYGPVFGLQWMGHFGEADKDVPPIVSSKVPASNVPAHPPAPDLFGEVEYPAIAYQPLKELRQPFFLQFPNNLPFLNPEPQFISGYEKVTCSTVMELEGYLYRLHELVKAIEKKGLQHRVSISLRLQGYANDTGDAAHNLKLAKARSNFVQDYLLTPDVFKPHIEDVMPDTSSFLTLMRSRGIPMPGSQLCGVWDSRGNDIGGIETEPLKSAITIYNDTRELKPGENPHTVLNQEIRKEFGLSADPESPQFRMVRIQMEIKKDGNTLGPRELNQFIDELEMKGVPDKSDL